MKDSRSDKEIGVLFCGAPVIGAVGRIHVNHLLNYFSGIEGHV